MSKPVDPATRLSDLLAQSLEELTRPFDPPRPAHAPRTETERGEAARIEPTLAQPQAHLSAEAEPPQADAPPPEDSRVDADRALAELEAELFAAAKEVDRKAAEAGEGDAEGAEGHEAPESGESVALTGDSAAGPLGDEKPADRPAMETLSAPALAGPEPEAVPPMDADAERLVARVRRLMLVSMAVTMIAVGSVFGFIGYRVSQGEGFSEKPAAKQPVAPVVSPDVTLALPRGARVIQSSVAGERLIITLEIDGKLEVRTFDVMTLQPAGRLNFSATP